jgi:putative transposase
MWRVQAGARYPTDRTEAERTLLAPLIPAAKPGGRPRTTDMREVAHASFCVLRGGCQWRLLPTEFPPHQTVDHYFRTWRQTGVWERMHDTLRGDLREASGRTRSRVRGSLRGYPETCSHLSLSRFMAHEASEARRPPR